MALPSIRQGLIEVEDGKVFDLDSPKGARWLETLDSFRYEPICDSKAYTVRRELSGYWYGCRKIAGTVRKKYIGKSSELIPAKLDEIAVALEDSPPPVPRVKKVAEGVVQVAEVAGGVVQVAEVAEDRFTALELQVANLQKALEALQERLPGKLEPGDSAELPKVDNAVVEGLQNDLSNLKAENEILKQELADARADCAKLLESSGQIKASREKEIAELRSQLEAEKKSGKEREEEFWGLHEQWESSKKEVRELQSELSDLKQNSAAAGELPEAAEIYNQFKAGNPKTKTTYTIFPKICYDNFRV